MEWVVTGLFLGDMSAPLEVAFKLSILFIIDNGKGGA